VGRKLPLVWMFLQPDTEASTALLKTTQEVAREFKGKLSFVHVDGVKFADHAKNFGLKGKLPGIAIEDKASNKRYIYPADAEAGAATSEALRGWVQRFVDKKLEAFVKSQPVPVTNDGPVKVVVGKTFESIVMDTTKDVFVEFYAPWCGHCKSLAPKWEKLGEMFADEPTIVIAKVDATENDTPAQTSVKGFPTLLFYPATPSGKHSPIKYSGERTEEAMAAWLREKARTIAGKGATSSASGEKHRHAHAHDDKEL